MLRHRVGEDRAGKAVLILAGEVENCRVEQLGYLQGCEDWAQHTISEKGAILCAVNQNLQRPPKSGIVTSGRVARFLSTIYCNVP